MILTLDFIFKPDVLPQQVGRDIEMLNASGTFHDFEKYLALTKYPKLHNSLFIPRIALDSANGRRYISSHVRQIACNSCVEFAALSF